MKLGSTRFAARQIRLVTLKGSTFTLYGVRIGIGFHWEKTEKQVFQGSLVLECGPDGNVQVINEILIEEYLKSVISSEMSAAAPVEFLNVHAIASRSWLAAMLHRKKDRAGAQASPPSTDAKEFIKWYDREDHDQFDVCADDHCQRYQEVGFAYGTVGIIALSAGGLMGGYVIYRNGFKRWIWPMVFAMHLPDLVFVYLSQAMPQSLFIVNCTIALYTMYMIMISEGDYRTVFYAISTGFIAFGMMIPGMFSGWLQETMGYPNFFLWIVISTIPGFVVPALVRIEPGYGKSQTQGENK